MANSGVPPVAASACRGAFYGTTHSRAKSPEGMPAHSVKQRHAHSGVARDVCQNTSAPLPVMLLQQTLIRVTLLQVRQAAGRLPRSWLLPTHGHAQSVPDARPPACCTCCQGVSAHAGEMAGTHCQAHISRLAQIPWTPRGMCCVGRHLLQTMSCCGSAQGIRGVSLHAAEPCLYAVHGATVPMLCCPGGGRAAVKQTWNRSPVS